MTRYRQPNQKKIYDELNKRLAKYVSLVQSIYDTLNLEASKIALGVDYDGNKPFSFRDFPSTKERILKVQKAFVSNLRSLIYRGTSDEWKRSNLMQDLLVDGVMKYYEGKTHREKHKKYYRVNSEQLKAFQERKDRGLNLSAKLWNQSKEYKTELEAALSNAIEKGQSAVTLSKRVSKYLKDFPSMQKDYKDKFGTASKAKDCQYMSMRLARSEINMAYRTAEQTRWRQLDFVVGYEIKLSGSHPKHDICDQLKGLYPKDFVWTGWHPNDMCYVVSKLKTWEEFENDDDTSVNAVNDVPYAFKNWVSEHKEYIDKAERKGTLPYFVKDNSQYINGKTNKEKKHDIETIKSNIIISEEISAGGVAEYDRNVDKIKMRKKDYDDLNNAIEKINKRDNLSDRDVEVIRIYSHERQHQLDKTAVGGGIGQQDVERILEAVNEIRSWRISKNIIGYDVTPVNFALDKFYSKEVGMLLQVGEILGVERSSFIKYIQNEAEGGIVGAIRALVGASKGKIEEDLARKIIDAAFVSDENYKFYKSKNIEVYNKNEIAKLINKLKLGRNGKRISKIHFTPKDFVDNGKVAFTIKEKKMYYSIYED